MLKDMPAAARPREKLLALGPAALADAELFALLLRTGLPGTGVLQLAQRCSTTFGGLPGCCMPAPASCSASRASGRPSAPRSPRCSRSRAASLAQRAGRSGRCSTRRERVKDYLRCSSARCEHEVFAVLFLDAQNRLLALEEMFRGTLTQTSVYPREVVKRALELRRGGGDPGPQPPVGRGRAVARRRVPDADA